MKKSKLMSAYKLHELRMWIVQIIIPAIVVYITFEPVRNWVNCKIYFIKWKLSETWNKIKKH